MFTFIRRLLVCLSVLWLSVSQASDSGWLRAADNDHARVRLRAQTQDGVIRLLLDVALEKGWKTYWRSPGEGGIAPAITWREPLPVSWQWPTPQRFDVAGISVQGYQGDVTFPLVITDPSVKKLAGVLTLSTCSQVCILTDYPFSLDPSEPADPGFSYDFIRATGSLPRSDGLTSSLSASYASGKLMVEATREAGWQQPQLYLDAIEGADFARPSFVVAGERLTVTVPVTDGWGEAALDLKGKSLSLVLADKGQAQESRITIEPANSVPATEWSLWLIIPMALLGGLILNVMPCVLPVLAMKLGTILRPEVTDRGVVRRQFLASVAGIVASFLALALMMTLLRISNKALGWGIQFQNPWFIGVMALVMVLFSASLLGLFAFRLSSGMTTFLATRAGAGLAGHFWQGAFATLLATPCAAPFLGTAVSVALVASLPVLWWVFLAMGAGMSLPWLAVAVWPGMALCLPRPGRWMNIVQVTLGLMLLTSALWLFTLLGTHIGQSLMLLIIAIVALVLLLATGWRYHWRVAARAGIIAAAVAVLGVLAVRSGSESVLRDRVNWQPLSEQAISGALQDGKRVFIDVTADWCVTCKANKYNVLLRDEVQQALRASDVVALRGDWSRPADDITRFLASRHNAGVPFNQIYGPGLPRGRALSTLLSREDVLQTLSDAKGK